MEIDKIAWAYIVGIALGDGNLSNPNGRAIRLRISCDSRYVRIIEEICLNLAKILPKNKVSLVKVRSKPNLLIVSIYSNKLRDLLPWTSGQGSKYTQVARVPNWIMSEREYIAACLRGLFQTDGSVYMDRGYRMVNFTNETKQLVDDVEKMITSLGFKPSLSIASDKNRPKYTIRVAKNSNSFIRAINLSKS